MVKLHENSLILVRQISHGDIPNFLKYVWPRQTLQSENTNILMAILEQLKPL